MADASEVRLRGKIRDAWGRWRERRRQEQLEHALYKVNGGSTGPFATLEHLEKIELAVGEVAPRVEAPKGKAPDPRAK